MHPAKSVIFFTTASGAGYGMMVWLAVLAWLGFLPTGPLFGLVAFGLALGLVTAGLLSSTLHLGRPERAWRALSQWRSSWLSREGVAALLAYVPIGLFALTWTFGWGERSVSAAIGLASAAMALATVWCTAMIYASLRTVPAWHSGWTRACYLVLGPMNGAVLLTPVLLLFGHAEVAALAALVALAMLVLGLATKLLYWRAIDRAPATSTSGTATGLGHLGKVEMTGSPHDADNYLLREMGFVIARKHARKLRAIAVLCGFVMPAVAILGALFTPGIAVPTFLTCLAALSCQAGLAAERWLFFAEAKHAVTLYYGAQAV